MWMAKSANMNESIKACGMCGQVCIVNRWMQYWLVYVEMSNVMVKLFNSNILIMGSYLAFYDIVPAYAGIMCRNNLIYLHLYNIIKLLVTLKFNTTVGVWEILALPVGPLIYKTQICVKILSLKFKVHGIQVL